MVYAEAQLSILLAWGTAFFLVPSPIDGIVRGVHTVGFASSRLWILEKTENVRWDQQ